MVARALAFLLADRDSSKLALRPGRATGVPDKRTPLSQGGQEYLTKA